VGGGVAALSAAVSAAEAGRTTPAGQRRHARGALAWRGDTKLPNDRPRQALRRAPDDREPWRSASTTQSRLVGVKPCNRRWRTPRKAAVLRERRWKIRARAVIAAAGALERPMLFPNNDRPESCCRCRDKYARALAVACVSESSWRPTAIPPIGSLPPASRRPECVALVDLRRRRISALKLRTCVPW